MENYLDRWALRQDFMRRIRSTMLQRLKSRFCPAIPSTPPIKFYLSQAIIFKGHTIDIRLNPSSTSTQLLFRFGRGRHPFNSWEDLSQDVHQLLILNSFGIIAGLIKAGFEVPKEILRAIREYEQKIRASAFLEATIKAIFLPFKFIPKSLHPNKIAA